jgi:hypothetical protein
MWLIHIQAGRTHRFVGHIGWQDTGWLDTKAGRSYWLAGYTGWQDTQV